MTVTWQGGPVDLTIRTGTTFRRAFVLYETVQGTRRPNYNAPISLTGYSGRAQMRNRAGGELLLDFTVTVDQAASGAGTGTVTLEASAALTAGLDTNGVYDVELVQGAEVVPFVYGKVTVEPGVTQP